RTISAPSAAPTVRSTRLTRSSRRSSRSCGWNGIRLTLPSLARFRLLQVHRHDYVNEIRSAFEQSGTVRRGHFQRDLIGIDHAQGFGHELRVEADLDVAAFEFA